MKPEKDVARYKVLAPDLAMESRRIENLSPFDVLDATGPVWALGFINIEEGSIELGISPQNLVEFKQGVFAIYKPPFSLMTARSKGMICTQTVYFSRVDLQLSISKQSPFTFTASSNQGRLTSLSEVAQLLERQESVQGFPYGAKSSVIARKMKQYLDEGIYSNVKVGEVAKRLEIDASQATRYFKAVYGISPAAYQSRMRVTASLYDLTIDDRRVLDVAHDVGFQDVSRYNKQFKKEISATPSDFRETSVSRGKIKSNSNTIKT